LATDIFNNEVKVRGSHYFVACKRKLATEERSLSGLPNKKISHFTLSRGVKQADKVKNWIIYFYEAPLLPIVK